MFVFRALFWFAVAVVVVPADYFESAQNKFYEVAPIVMSAVGEEVASVLFDMTDTCTDRPDICTAAQDLFTATSRPEPEGAERSPVLPAVHDERI